MNSKTNLVFSKKIIKFKLMIGLFAAGGIVFMAGIWTVLYSISLLLGTEKIEPDFIILLQIAALGSVFFFLIRYVHARLVRLEVSDDEFFFAGRPINPCDLKLKYQIVLFGTIFGVINFQDNIYFIAPKFYSTLLPFWWSTKISNKYLRSLSDKLALAGSREV